LRLTTNGRFQDLEELRSQFEVGREEVAEMKKEMNPVLSAVILYLLAFLAVALVVGLLALFGYYLFGWFLTQL
jgi:hypothetical protein